MLNKRVLIRHIIEDNKKNKLLSYKYKEYNKNKEITEQEYDSLSDDEKILSKKVNETVTKGE